AIDVIADKQCGTTWASLCRSETQIDCAACPDVQNGAASARLVELCWVCPACRNSSYSQIGICSISQHRSQSLASTSDNLISEIQVCWRQHHRIGLQKNRNAVRLRCDLAGKILNLNGKGNVLASRVRRSRDCCLVRCAGAQNQIVR